MLAIKKLSLFLTITVMLCACTTTVTNSSVPNLEKPSAKDKADIHAQLAQGYLQKKQLQTAKDELKKALKIHPKHSQANYMYALLLLELNKVKEADKYFKKAVDSDLDNSSAAHDYGVYLCRLGKRSEAIKYFDLAANNALFRRKELSLMRAGQCLSSIDVERAERYLRNALKINPRLSGALLQMAEIGFKKRNYLMARAHIERYNAVAGETAAGLMWAYRIERVSGSADIADEYKKKLVSKFPDSREASLVSQGYRSRSW